MDFQSHMVKQALPFFSALKSEVIDIDLNANPWQGFLFRIYTHIRSAFYLHCLQPHKVTWLLGFEVGSYSCAKDYHHPSGTTKADR